MKARIVRQKRALLWGVDPAREPAVSTIGICDRLGIVCRLPGKEGWTERVETLLDTPDSRGCPWEQPPLLLLSGLTDAELDDLLAQLRGAKAVWPYKAVVTPYNRSWSLEKLYRELEQEHRAVTGGGNEE